MGLLDGKVAVVTGAGRGIGRSHARLLAAEGARVVVNDLGTETEGGGTDSAPARAVVDEIIAAGGSAVANSDNVATWDGAGAVVQQALDEFGRLDILVNNAGIYEFSPLEDITEEHFHRQFDINVLGVLLATKEAVKHFGPAGGAIVNISSAASTVTPPQGSVYSATKAAVDAVTRSLAKELAPRNIRVNAVNPGVVETEGVHTVGVLESDLGKQLIAQIPLGRIGQPRDIAPAVAFLASDDAAWVTGETWLITGGAR